MHSAKATHFAHVARNMNNYVMALTQPYHYPRYHHAAYDRVHHMNMYGGSSLAAYGFGGLFAYGLNYIGMPRQVINIGYNVGYFLDTIA